MINKKQIEAGSQVFAQYELFDWETLPESDPAGVRDRQAIRSIVMAILAAAHEAND